MQAHRALGHCYHGAAFDLLCKPFDDLADQLGNVGAAKTFVSDADYRGAVGAADRSQSMEVRVERHDGAALFPRQVGNLRIARAAVPDVGDMADVETALPQVPHGAAR